MADRTVRVTLAAEVNGYLANMDRAAAKTRDVGTAAEKLAAQRQGFDVLGRSMLAVGAAAAAGVGLAVAKFADFDAQMSSVQAATHETAGNMDLLRAAALEAGQSTVFSATEAAEAIENLAKAGVSTADIMGGGLTGALDLAAAGQLAVGDAAEIAATAMTQFNLEGTAVPHIADLLAAAAGKAQGEVSDMAAALNQSGLVASQMGLSIEETTGTLASFASAGLIGSDAGTSFRTMLLRLANPTEEAKDLMADLGISAYDAQGNFVGMEAIAGQLQGTMGGLDQSTRDAAMATLFGSDAIRAANVLYTQGSEGVAEWTAKVDDSGYAAETAALRMDNLKGDVEKLGGALDTALIQTGGAANGALRFLTQAATDSVDAFSKMDPAVQGIVLGVGALVAAASLAGGAFFIAVPKVAAFNAALATMGPGAQRAAGALGAVGKGLGAIAVAVAAVAVLNGINDAIEGVGASSEELQNQLQTAGLGAAFEAAFVTAKVGADNGKAAISDMGATIEDVANSWDTRWAGVFGEGMLTAFDSSSDASDDMRDAFASMGEELGTLASTDLPAAQKAFSDYVESQNLTEEQTLQLIDLMPAWRDALTAQATELGLTADNQTLLKLAMEETTPAAEAAADAAAKNADELTKLQGGATEAEGAIEGLSDAIRGFGDTAISAEEASMDFEAAVDDAKEAVKENGQELDKGTAKGRANREALIAIAKAAKENSAATLERTGSEEKARAKVEQGREALIKAARQMGMSKEEAGKYADKLGLIPKNVGTAVKLSGVGAAEAALQHLARNRISYIQAITTGQSGTGANRAVANGGMFAYADGGVQSYAGGGVANGIYSGGAPIYKFAEPETGWEAFISGRRGRERENLGYAYAAIGRLEKSLGMGGGGGSGVNVTINQVNPLAEPASETIRTASQYLGALMGGN